MSSYLYRCTEQQLEAHLQRIVEAGDVVEHVIFKGGRDYVLVCRKTPEPMAVRIIWDDDEVRAVVKQAMEAAREFSRKLDRLGR